MEHSNFYLTDLSRGSELYHKLNSLQKQHKEINELIHIYNHKANYYIEPAYQVKKNKSLEVLPDIKKTDSKIERKTYSKKKNLPKYSLEEAKLKLIKVKENIQIKKEKKQKEAKDMKEKNRIMRENVVLFKEKLKEENRQKKRIIEAKYNLTKNAIENYKTMKKEYILTAMKEGIDKDMKELMKKQETLKYLKEMHEENVSKFRLQKYDVKAKPSEPSEIRDENYNSKNFEKFLMKAENKDNVFLTDIVSSKEI